MSLVSEVAAWFADPANWDGAGGVPNRIAQHLQYTAVAVVLAGLIAVPIGAAIGHTGRGGFLVVGLANGMRALPELGLLTLLVLGVGIGLLPLLVALVVLAVPPLLAGTYAGVRNADAAVVDAARGAGLREREVLVKVELPVALPLIIGGLRTATLQVIATAAIGAYIALGGLGRYLIDGLAVQDYPRMVAGAVLIAALALLVEGLLAVVQRAIVSPGLRSGPARVFSARLSPTPHVPDPEPRHRRRNSVMKRALVGLVGMLALALSACGGGDPLADSAGGSAANQPPAAGDIIRVGSANFTENRLLGEIYAQALEADGVTVERRFGIGSREIYFPALQDGSIDLIPEYTGNLLQEVDPETTATASAEVYTQVEENLPDGLVVLEQSAAENKDAVVVTQETAERLNARSIADLAPSCGELTFGGPPEFAERPYGLPGLERLYGCTFADFRSLDAGGTLTVTALADGTIQAADVFTTDPTIADRGWVVLEDPMNNFAAQNVVPLITEAKAGDGVRQTLNAISAALTTEDLVELNRQLTDAANNTVESVATEWLTANGLV